MKNWIVLIAAVVLLYVGGQYVKQVYQYKKYASCVAEINLLLEAAKADSSKIGKFFKANDLYLEKSSFFQKLVKRGIVGSNTEIFYKSKDCICLIIMLLRVLTILFLLQIILLFGIMILESSLMDWMICIL